MSNKSFEFFRQKFEERKQLLKDDNPLNSACLNTSKYSSKLQLESTFLLDLISVFQ